MYKLRTSKNPELDLSFDYAIDAVVEAQKLLGSNKTQKHTQWWRMQLEKSGELNLKRNNIIVSIVNIEIKNQNILSKFIY